MIPIHVKAAELPVVADEQCQQGLWLLPSHNRPIQASQCISACVAAGQSTPGLLVQDGCSYTKLSHPTSLWSAMEFPHSELAGALTAAWQKNRGLLWYGVISDGVRPITKNWDRLLIAASQGRNFVSCSDNGWREDKRMAGILLVPGWIVEAMGYWFPADMTHLYTDNVWEELGRALGNWVFAEDVVVEDNHFSHPNPAHRTSFDHVRTFNGQPYGESDRARFEQWRSGYEFALAVERIKEDWEVATGTPWEAKAA